jgi:hypothetical protein
MAPSIKVVSKKTGAPENLKFKFLTEYRLKNLFITQHIVLISLLLIIISKV